MYMYLIHIFEWNHICQKSNTLRKYISKFRTSSHCLRIETGRHEKRKPEATERVCLFCNDKKTDDEIHFLLSCHYHAYDRQILFQNIANEIDFTRSDIEIFISIMDNRTPYIMTQLGHFLRQSMEYRKTIKRRCPIQYYYINVYIYIFISLCVVISWSVLYIIIETSNYIWYVLILLSRNYYAFL